MSSFKCIDALAQFLKTDFPQAQLPADWTVVPDKCPPNMDGDLTVNCFRLAKALRSAPDKIAESVNGFFAGNPDVEKSEQIKAFVNITLKPEAVHRDSVGDIAALLKSGRLPAVERRKFIVEYSAPNTNKPQHLGHVRNNTLGMSLASLLHRVGNDVTQINLVNDRGIHICKSMLAYDRVGEGVTPDTTGIKGDHLVGDFYVRYNNLLTEEIADLKNSKPELADKSDDQLFLETELGQATQKMLRDWEAGDEEVRALWKKMNSWVFTGFGQTYKRMGIEFDHTYLESDTYLLGKDVIADGLERGVFSRREDGAVIADLGKMGEKVILRSDGTSVYITQDIGTTLKKYEDYRPDAQIWVVGDEQILHFKMLFAIMKKLGYDWADNLYHLAYGMVNLPSGKMKSREGTVVDADDLFDEMCALAKVACEERYGGEVTSEEIAERAEIIGMGALKFMLLKFNPKTTMMFDPQASVKFEGDTGPYVQYACARINSIERKAAERGIAVTGDVDWALLGTPEEKAVSVAAFYYPQILQTAAGKMDCSVLVEYLLELAKAFNRFYRECPVLTAETDELKSARMALCHAVREILTDGLNTLTIRVPEAM
ncbi:arginine--tRNA ligase [Lentisphaerota bacterium ZTH]|nr:arginine--tRNA ligase [Lentisphaerota bacterium]WET06015.1 arginine--tRNA ligase [Lentisphaerota bacterium ZTH]